MGAIPSHTRGDDVFTNHAILYEMLPMMTSKDLRSLRLLNRPVNALCTEILNLRKSPVKALCLPHVVTSFLDTIQNRIEDALSYSAFRIHVSGISRADLTRFGNVMSNSLRRLTINFHKPFINKSFFYWLWNLGFQSVKECTDGKIKALLLLHLFPNIQELRLESDEVENLLTPDEITFIPMTFPRLKVIEVTEFHDNPIFSRTDLQGNPASNTFISVISSRSPTLDYLVMTGYCFYSLPYQQTQFIIQGQRNSPTPGSTLTPILLASGEGILDQTIFVANMTDHEYNPLRTFSVLLFCDLPKPLANEIYDSIDIQNVSLDWLTLYLYIYWKLKLSLTLVSCRRYLKYAKIVIINHSNPPICPIGPAKHTKLVDPNNPLELFDSSYPKLLPSMTKTTPWFVKQRMTYT